ncbi:MAG: polyprenyl synthetase family protein [Nitrospinae bacterium]|nr:polyprenyl synthetase family protein [Nitrospinota bacterium]
MGDIERYLQEQKALVDAALARFLPPEENYPPVIFQAMRYSIFAGGKRVRPILALAAAEAVGATPEDVLPMVCALECIHTYSLIHDDLPAMDNDDYRRGRLTNHKMFGEANAILAGDALLTFAFELMTDARHWRGVSPACVLQVVCEIAYASGAFGLIGGQVVDLQMERQAVDLPTLQYIHSHKTGALIRASVRSGAILGGGSPGEVEALTAYGTHIGLAFQIMDDILDVRGDEQLMGKGLRKDDARQKATYPRLLGLEESEARAQTAAAAGIAALEPLGERGALLHALAQFIISRDS